MKRIIAVVCLLAAMVALCSGCGKFTCADCQQELRGKRYVLEVAGEEFPLCKTCYREYLEKKEEMNAPVSGGMGDLSAVL